MVTQPQREAGARDPAKRAGIFSFLRGAKTDGRSNPFGYLFIAPAVILYLVFNIWPLFRGVAMAFTDYRFIYPKTRWDFNGIDNFKEMIADRAVRESFVIAAQYTLIVLPLLVIISLFIAVMISKARTGASFYRWMVYLPSILPVAVAFLMFGQMYNYKFGFINGVLRNFGVASPPDWLGNPQYVIPAIATADLWRAIGFPVLLFLIGLYNINGDLYEAASIDGANAWQQFWKITLPLLKSSFSLIFILNVGMIGVVEPMLILTNGTGPQNSARTIGVYLYQVAFAFGDLRLGYAAAVSLVIGIISALLSLVVFRLLRD